MPAEALRADGRSVGPQDILIVGGYGEVGGMIAERLAARFKGRVIIAGRDRAKAEAAAARIGAGARGRVFDLFAPEPAGALDGVALAIVCLDQTDPGFAKACLARGVSYLDITAGYAFLERVEALDFLARENGAIALLSVGVSPGLTNMLARRACELMTQTDRIDILLELGLGDRHGRAAIEWMLDNLDAPFEVMEAGRLRVVRSFGERLRIVSPFQVRARSAYRFGFSDQRVIARETGVPSVSTWLRFDTALATALFARLARIGLSRLTRRPFWRRRVVNAVMGLRIGSDRCVAAVRATGRTHDGATSLSLGVSGRREALMTAVVAAEAARQLLSGSIPPGIRHSGAALALDPVIRALAQDVEDFRARLGP